MSTKNAPIPPATKGAAVLPIKKSAPAVTKLLEQYGCGPVQLSEKDNGLYERHLVFDNIVDVAASNPRIRYEAIAHAVRDVLSQRWIRTENTYQEQNPKRIYYLSMEFLIGRIRGRYLEAGTLSRSLEASPMLLRDASV